MGLEWNWRESSHCNLLTARRLSVDYTLLRSSISEKRPSSCATRARYCDALCEARVMQFLLQLCAHLGSVFRQLREIMHARVARGGAAIRAGCAHCSGSVRQQMYPAIVRAERHCVVRGSTSVGGHSGCQFGLAAAPWNLSSDDSNATSPPCSAKSAASGCNSCRQLNPSRSTPKRRSQLNPLHGRRWKSVDQDNRPAPNQTQSPTSASWASMKFSGRTSGPRRRRKKAGLRGASLPPASITKDGDRHQLLTQRLTISEKSESCGLDTVRHQA